MEKNKVRNSEEHSFNAYTIVKCADPIRFKLIRLKIKGKSLHEVETILEEILPVVLGRVETLLKTEGLEC